VHLASNAGWGIEAVCFIYPPPAANGVRCHDETRWEVALGPV